MKAPMNPIMSRSRSSGVRYLPSVKLNARRPMRKLPATLTKSVPAGKEGNMLLKYFTIRNLSTAPRKPPTPI